LVIVRIWSGEYKRLGDLYIDGNGDGKQEIVKRVDGNKMKGKITKILEVGNCELSIEPMNYRLEIKSGKITNIVYPNSLSSALKIIYEERLKENIKKQKENNNYDNSIKSLAEVIEITKSEFDEIFDGRIKKHIEEKLADIKKKLKEE